MTAYCHSHSMLSTIWRKVNMKPSCISVLILNHNKSGISVLYQYWTYIMINQEAQFCICTEPKSWLIRKPSSVSDENKSWFNRKPSSVSTGPKSWFNRKPSCVYTIRLQDLSGSPLVYIYTQHTWLNRKPINWYTNIRWWQYQYWPLSRGF